MNTFDVETLKTIIFFYNIRDIRDSMNLFIINL